MELFPHFPTYLLGSTYLKTEKITSPHTVNPYLMLFWLYMVETKHTGKNCLTIKNLNAHGHTWYLLFQPSWKLAATPTHVMSSMTKMSENVHLLRELGKGHKCPRSLKPVFATRSLHNGTLPHMPRSACLTTVSDKGLLYLPNIMLNVLLFHEIIAINYRASVLLKKKSSHEQHSNRKFIPVLNQAPCHEDSWGSSGTAPHILNTCTRWM